MNKKMYLELKEVQDEKIKAAEKSIEDFKKVYISVSKKASIGDKIEITTNAKVSWNGRKTEERKRFAFVKNITVDNYGNIEYDVFKCKADGTQSKHRGYIHVGETIKIVTKSTT